LARFWGAVLERPVEGAGEGFWVSLPDGNQPSGIFFWEVRDAKQVKNRLHLDLNHGDGTLAAELKRLTALGATVLARHNRGPGLGWVVLADPEGNEFCVQSSDAEVAAVQERLDAGTMPAGRILLRLHSDPLITLCASFPRSVRSIDRNDTSCPRTQADRSGVNRRRPPEGTRSHRIPRRSVH
jgi:predicted enzyme related to lactoylglutathione lyase